MAIKDQGRAATPYEQGVAHLKRAEYAEAVRAFTEAIRLEPDAPNGYSGRSLAHKLLGDEAASLQDKEASQALGGTERCAWDRLVNQAKRRWRGDLSNPEWQRCDPLSRKATLLRRWVWQIYNGGITQWVANGYGDFVEDLARATEEVGTGATQVVARAMRDVADVLTRWPNARHLTVQLLTNKTAPLEQSEQLFMALSECQAAYDEVGSAFSADVEAWLERQNS